MTDKNIEKLFLLYNHLLMATNSPCCYDPPSSPLNNDGVIRCDKRHSNSLAPNEGNNLQTRTRQGPIKRLLTRLFGSCKDTLPKTKKIKTTHQNPIWVTSLFGTHK